MTDQKLCAPSMPWPWLFQYPSTWMMRHVSEHRHVWHVYISLVFRLRIFGRSTGRENSDIVGECARWAFHDIEWFLMFLLFERYIQIGAAHGRPVYRQQGSTTVIRYWSRTWSEQNRALLVGELWRVVTKTGTFSTQATTKALGHRSRRSPRVWRASLNFHSPSS